MRTLLQRIKVVAVLGWVGAMLICGGVWGATGNVQINYQGVVEVEGGAYNGAGHFKFTLGDAAGQTNFWSNDGTAEGEPAGAVLLVMSNGFFAVALGNPSLMTALPQAVFVPGTGVYVRVWFNYQASGTYYRLGPAQILLPVPTALNADLLDGYDYADIVFNISTSLYASGVVTMTTMTNTFLLRTGDTCFGLLTASNLVSDTGFQARNGDVTVQANRRVYFDGTNRTAFILSSTNGMISIYKHGNPVLEVE